MSDDSSKKDSTAAAADPAAPANSAPIVPDTPTTTTWKLPDGIEDHLAKGKDERAFVGCNNAENQFPVFVIDW